MNHWEGLRPAERIVAMGAAAAAGSLLFPWYGIELELFGGFSQTGLEAFNFAHAGILATAGGALALVLLHGGGYRLPRPLSEGVLLILAGAWLCVLVAYLAIERPENIAGFDRVRLRYGLFVALGGGTAIALGGIRLRRAPTHTVADVV